MLCTLPSSPQGFKELIELWKILSSTGIHHYAHEDENQARWLRKNLRLSRTHKPCRKKGKLANLHDYIPFSETVTNCRICTTRLSH